MVGTEVGKYVGELVDGSVEVEGDDETEGTFDGAADSEGAEETEGDEVGTLLVDGANEMEGDKLNVGDAVGKNVGNSVG